MSENSRYGVFRGLFMTFCVLIIGGGIFRSCSNSFQTPQNTSAIHANFQRRFCGDFKTINHSTENIERFSIPLKEGCFGPRVLVPEAWNTYEVQLSQNTGDYAAVWCNGEVNPRRTVEYYTQGGLDDVIKTTCAAKGENTTDLSMQGQGIVTFVRTQSRSVTPTIEASTSILNKQNVPILPDVQYKITPMSPTSGLNPSYSFILQECHRAGQQIQCSTKVKNNTDSETVLYLHNASTAIDDEGNQARITFAFSGGNRHLPPSVWVNCDLSIPDTHLDAKSVTIEIRANFMDKANALDILMFKDVPIQ